MKKSSQIIVVSGLPRSGTSLMMQMLVAAGMPICSDRERKADLHNPRGYFEHQKVKRLPADPALLYSAGGKVVKIVSPLLRYLPPDLSYKIIFMQRDLDEVILSQNKLLNRPAPSKQEIYRLREYYLKHLAGVQRLLEESENMEYIFVPFKRLISAPKETAATVSRFLNGKVEIAKMARVVNPSLYRTKKRADPF